MKHQQLYVSPYSIRNLNSKDSHSKRSKITRNTHLKLTEEQEADLREAFDIFSRGGDETGDGTIDAEDLKVRSSLFSVYFLPTYLHTRV
jgi:hypothetical protein